MTLLRVQGDFVTMTIIIVNSQVTKNLLLANKAKKSFAF